MCARRNLKCIALFTCLQSVLMECNVPHCMNDICTDQVCTSCYDGFYLTENGYCRDCPSSCTKCTALNNCSECIPVRYGVYCQLDCPIGCNKRLCDKETATCIEGCKEGFYLHSNNQCHQCSAYCINGSCDQISGFCTIGCVDGYRKDIYGRCSVCPDTCKGRLCDRETSECTNGCVEHHFLTVLKTCEACPSECLNLRCENESGLCIDGCIDYYYRTSTKKCSRCPSECVGRQCDRETGVCIPRYYMTAYNVCQICPSSCKNQLCDDNSGFCKNGCNDGFYLSGGTCKDCNTRCRDRLCADGTGACTSGCIDGFYMNYIGHCEYCPEHCSKCSNVHVCTECIAGYWGDKCQKKCFEGCQYSECDFIEGHCLKGCYDGYTDVLCDIPSTRDNVVIGLSVTVGLLVAFIALAVLLFIMKLKRKDVFCLGTLSSFLAKKTDNQTADVVEATSNSRPSVNNANNTGYINPSWSGEDPQYSSLSDGYERPI